MKQLIAEVTLDSSVVVNQSSEPIRTKKKYIYIYWFLQPIGSIYVKFDKNRFGGFRDVV